MFIFGPFFSCLFVCLCVCFVPERKRDEAERRKIKYKMKDTYTHCACVCVCMICVQFTCSLKIGGNVICVQWAAMTNAEMKNGYFRVLTHAKLNNQMERMKSQKQPLTQKNGRRTFSIWMPFCPPNTFRAKIICKESHSVLCMMKTRVI